YFNVPYFSDLKRFAAACQDRPPGVQSCRFLFSGSLITRKGVDLLAQAFATVASEFPTVSLTVVGAGPLENEMRSRLEDLGKRVTFAGFQSWEKLPQYYAEADVLVAPSRHDGWALVVPEALASGLPV